MAIKNSVSNNFYLRSLIVFLIAICCHSGDKWQSKTLFLTIFYLRSLIVLTFLIGAYLVWEYSLANTNMDNKNPTRV